ncbi:MAG: helix-turn-helix transcriptional regulator [Nitrospinae bacterium]|nr:helix-turn-helix transcriptional regulator [Nitrospinota bacterium]
MLSNIANPPSLIELSGMAGMNHKKLNRGFRSKFGKTTYAWVVEHRMEMARAAMHLRGITVAEAAYLAGYSHPSNFTTAFKKCFGYPPG